MLSSPPVSVTRPHRRAGKSILLAALPLALLLSAHAAQAQQVGTYKGTNNEGDEVEVVVASKGSNLVVTVMTDGGVVYCKGKALATYGIEVGLAGTPISNGMASIEVFDTTLYYDSGLTFSGNSVGGTIAFAVPLYNKKKTPPKTACSAATMPQSFSATLTADEVHAPAPGTVIARPIDR